MADPYYTVAEIRTLVRPLSDDGKYPDTLIEALIAEFEELAERARGVAYRHREATTTLLAPACRTTLPHVMLVSVDSVTVDGTEWTTEQVEEITVIGALGVIEAHWTGGLVVDVAYTHGYETPGPSILRGCREFVRARAIETQGNAPRNTSGYSDDSGREYRFERADWNAGKYTGLTVVDDAINTATDHRVPGLG
jgi:hypothetical protein